LRSTKATALRSSGGQAEPRLSSPFSPGRLRAEFARGRPKVDPGLLEEQKI